MSSKNLSALIGYTGFVGGNLYNQNKFDRLYNSKNIAEIEGKEFDFIFCAGARAEKWKANQNPKEDLQSIQDLTSHLEKIQAKKFVLISTIDVYPQPQAVNENSPIDPKKNSPYGKNRFFLEQFVEKNFPDHLIVRLPGLFGTGIKKNLVFDIVHDNNLEAFDRRSNFQFYNLDNLWRDIQIALTNNLKTINFATEPVSVKEVFEVGAGRDFDNTLKKEPVSYNMKTLYAHMYKQSSDYLYSKTQILEQIKAFISKEKI